MAKLAPIIAATLFTCCATSPQPLPLPSRVSPPGPLPSSSAALEQYSNELRDAVQRTEFDVPKERREAVYAAVVDGLRFLEGEFGSPPFTCASIKVVLGENLARHAVTDIRPSCGRVIEIDVLNLYESQRHFIVHELFHAYYQPDAMLDRPKADLERWATYAQYRYKYPGQRNSEIWETLSERFGLNPPSSQLREAMSQPWVSLSNDLRNQVYVLNTEPLFRRDHEENHQEYRELLRQMAGAVPLLASRTPRQPDGTSPKPFRDQ